MKKKPVYKVKVKEMSILDLSPTELKRLKVITKKEFLNKGGQE